MFSAASLAFIASSFALSASSFALSASSLAHWASIIAFSACSLAPIASLLESSASSSAIVSWLLTLSFSFSPSISSLFCACIFLVISSRFRLFCMSFSTDSLRYASNSASPSGSMSLSMFPSRAMFLVLKRLISSSLVRLSIFIISYLYTLKGIVLFLYPS